MGQSTPNDDLRARVLAEVRRADGIDQHLKQHYGVEVTSMASLDGVWGRVRRVELRDGALWVVRVFSEHRPAERVHGDAEILRFVEHHGFPAERCAHHDAVSRYEDQTLLVTTHVDGVTSDITVEHEAALADLLGRLHALPTGEGAAARPGGALHHDPAREGRPHEDLVAANGFLDAAEIAINTEQRPLLERLRKLVGAADGCEGLPEALLHPDMVGPNVPVTESGERVAVDWTGAGRGPRLASLAFLLWGAGLKPGGDASIIDAIVRSYRRHVELTAEEVDRLPAAMRVRPAYFASWGLWRAIEKGQQITGTERWWPDPELGEAIATSTRSALARR
ncbi:MAG TPA: phosphotransferase [Acidimicrobiales bacterium]|nr:phosphotransferase [Acidimicrobiales bacterium]